TGEVGESEARALRGRLRDPGSLPGRPAGGLGGAANRRSIPVDHQPQEDSGGACAPAGRERGFLGFHFPLRPRPIRSRSSLPERVSLEEGAATAAGQTAGTDLLPTGVPPDPCDDRRGQSGVARLEKLLLSRLPSRRLSEDQLVRPRPSDSPLATTEPTTLPTAGRGDVLRPTATPWLAVTLIVHRNSLCMLCD